MKLAPCLFLVLPLVAGTIVTGCSSSQPPENNSQSETEQDVATDPQEVVPDDTDPIDDNAATAVGPFDGTYTVTFITHGVQAALGTLVVDDSRFSGDLVSIYNEVFWIEGYLDNDGNFVFDPIEGDQGSVVVADGQIQEGLVSGTYDVNDGERGGIFSGSLGSTPFDLNPVKDFDGTYEVSMFYLNSEIGTTVFNIENGRFSASLTTLEDARFDLGGFVTSDGTLVVSMLDGSATLDSLLAEGSIDHETQEIEGMYRIGPFAGTVSGKFAD